MIVRQLKSLIASDILGQSALFEVSNQADKAVIQAVQEAVSGNAGNIRAQLPSVETE